MTVITIPSKIKKGQELIAVEKKSFDKLIQENAEFKSAIQAIMEGEFSLRQGNTRSFKDFLKFKLKYAKNR